MKLNKEFIVEYKHLRIVACIYISLPLLLFLGGFLKWYYALISIAALLYSFYRVVTSNNTEPQHNHTTKLTLSTILLVFAFTMVWTHFGGLNGCWYQSSDWDCRNAIYWDMILQDWPVRYKQNGGALSYYIGHWVAPSCFAKVILWITESADWALMAGRMALWVWSSLGLTIVILLIFHYLNVISCKRRFFSVFVFVCFSGMDIFGGLLKNNLDYLLSDSVLHLEWWTTQYQFTSITACVYWVFNQTIIPWIIVLCFMMEKDARNYIFYCVACLLCGPFPCIGLAICMLVKAICYSIGQFKKVTFKEALTDTRKSIFSSGNITAFLLVFPFIAAYILTNDAFGATIANLISGTTTEAALVKNNFFSRVYWSNLLIAFLILEVGIYYLLICFDQRRNPMFYTIIFISLIAPYFHIGTSIDFCMRASVPAIFILMLFVNDYLQKYLLTNDIGRLDASKKYRKRTKFRHTIAIILMVCFMFGAVTTVVEVFRGCYHVISAGTIYLEDRSIGTFNRADLPLNFGCSVPEETFFYQYLAK